MAERENEALVLRVEAAWDSGDLDALPGLLAPDFDNSQSARGDLPKGLEGAKLAHLDWARAFPDRRVIVEDVIAEGDRVVVRGRITGTNLGGVAWLGVPANGNSIDVAFISIYRVAGGRVAEHWGMTDTIALVMQLGAGPTGDRSEPA